MSLVRATERVEEIECCLRHGTGLTMSRSDAKRAAINFDFANLRRQVYITARVDDASLRTEAPTCYRGLDDALALMNGFVEEVERLSPVPQIGQL